MWKKMENFTEWCADWNDKTSGWNETGMSTNMPVLMMLLTCDGCMLSAAASSSSAVNTSDVMDSNCEQSSSGADTADSGHEKTVA